MTSPVMRPFRGASPTVLTPVWLLLPRGTTTLCVRLKCVLQIDKYIHCIGFVKVRKQFNASLILLCYIAAKLLKTRI